MVEYNYGGGFIHETLNILQSHPCTSCHSWCLSGSRPIIDISCIFFFFSPKLKYSKKNRCERVYECIFRLEINNKCSTLTMHTESSLVQSMNICICLQSNKFWFSLIVNTLLTLICQHSQKDLCLLLIRYAFNS